MFVSRVGGIVAVVLVVAATLAPCAGDKEPPGATGTGAAGAESAPGMLGNMYRSGLPIVKEPVRPLLVRWPMPTKTPPHTRMDQMMLHPRASQVHASRLI